MNRRRYFINMTIGFAAVFFLFGSAFAAPYQGLWVGSTALKHVSEINTRRPDMSFDLSLEGVRRADALVSRGSSEWRYLQVATAEDDPGTDWKSPAFDAEAWPMAFATEISDAVTTYFRTDFGIDQPDQYSILKLQVWRRHGVVIYLNGREIFRNNLRPTVTGHDAKALSLVGEETYLETIIPAEALKAGTNIVAVAVYPATDATDILFDLALGAETDQNRSVCVPMKADGWRYQEAFAEGWQNSGFDDAGWSQGKARFVYGEALPTGFDGTEMSFGAAGLPGVIYFRKAFSAAELSDFTNLRLFLLRDDGAVVHINGKQVLRSNMTDASVDQAPTPVMAVGSAEEGLYKVHEISLSGADSPALKATGNVIAVEIHQHSSELGEAPADATALTDTPAALDLKFLLHVDADGNVNLLKEVLQMYDSENQKLVLLTDQRLIPKYSGVALRDGKSVGRRVSAVGFDFEGLQLPCTKTGFGASGAVTCNIVLDRYHSTNPFLHRYHPDHDNLDSRYEARLDELHPGEEGEKYQEVYEISRQITISFDDRYPPDEDAPEWPSPPLEWGDTLLGGSYSETLTGLHKMDIKVNGPFIMQRVSGIGSLNQ